MPFTEEFIPEVLKRKYFKKDMDRLMEKFEPPAPPNLGAWPIEYLQILSR